ncbi:hypothetical protein [Helicobacter canis]|nr:hypothetical protein [Helicobacter canis]
MRNLCFASAHKGAYLIVCNRRAREAIKDLSRKAESTKKGNNG